MYSWVQFKSQASGTIFVEAAVTFYGNAGPCGVVQISEPLEPLGDSQTYPANFNCQDHYYVVSYSYRFVGGATIYEGVPVTGNTTPAVDMLLVTFPDPD